MHGIHEVRPDAAASGCADLQVRHPAREPAALQAQPDPGLQRRIDGGRARQQGTTARAQGGDVDDGAGGPRAPEPRREHGGARKAHGTVSGDVRAPQVLGRLRAREVQRPEALGTTRKPEPVEDPGREVARHRRRMGGEHRGQDPPELRRRVGLHLSAAALPELLRHQVVGSAAQLHGCESVLEGLFEGEGPIAENRRYGMGWAAHGSDWGVVVPEACGAGEPGGLCRGCRRLASDLWSRVAMAGRVAVPRLVGAGHRLCAELPCGWRWRSSANTRRQAGRGQAARVGVSGPG